LNYTEADFEAVADLFVAAARAMQADGWRRHAPDASNTSTRRRILREILARNLSGKRAAATTESPSREAA
jgi:glutamate-1-semialdehyde 2,1-aminomutase